VNNKISILATGIRPFAWQSNEATTTFQFARDDGAATAPLFFYNFKNNQTLYSTVFEDAANGSKARRGVEAMKPLKIILIFSSMSSTVLRG
jgi:hypothetical protein